MNQHAEVAVGGGAVSDVCFLRSGGLMPFLLHLFSFIQEVHSYIYIRAFIFIRRVLSTFSSLLSAQWAEPPLGAESEFEPGEQAGALPSELLRRTPSLSVRGEYSW